MEEAKMTQIKNRARSVAPSGVVTPGVYTEAK